MTFVVYQEKKMDVGKMLTGFACAGFVLGAVCVTVGPAFAAMCAVILCGGGLLAGVE